MPVGVLRPAMPYVLRAAAPIVIDTKPPWAMNCSTTASIIPISMFGDDATFPRCNTSKQGPNLLYQNCDQNLAFKFSSFCFEAFPTAVDTRECHATRNIDCSDAVAYRAAGCADFGE